MTTHYLEEAEELCDEIAVINHGKVIAQDSKENLMKILSKKELILNSVEKLPKDLKVKNLGVKILNDDKFSITYDPNDIEVEEILKIIARNKIQIKDISTAQPDLEEIFKFLILNK